MDAKKNADAFLVHVIEASRASVVGEESCYCNSGTTRHITPNKLFVIHKICQPWDDRVWQEKCADTNTQSRYDKRPDISRYVA